MFAQIFWLYSLAAVHTAVLDHTGRATGLLSDNLRRFYASAPALDYNTKNLEVPSLSLSPDLLVHVGEYLDYSSLKELEATSKQFKKIKKDVITLKLVNFDRYFFFEDDWFNEVMFKVINENFPSGLNLKSPNIYDYVELMTLKYIRGDYKLKNIPKYIYFGILSFINEMVYGPESYVSSNSDEFKYSLGTKLLKYDLPLSLSYYITSFEPNQSTIDILNFLATKPDRNEMAAFVSTNGNIRNNFGMAFGMVFEEALSEDTFEGSRAERILSDLSITGCYSLNLLKKIKWTNNLRNLLKTRYEPLVHKTWFLRALFRLPEAEVHFSDAMAYLWSCDLMNTFDIERIKDIADFRAPLIFNELLRVKMPFLITLDISLKLVRSGLLNLESGEAKCFFQSSTIDPPLFELILTESPTKVKLFVEVGWGRNSAMLEYLESERLEMIFDTQLATDPENPLAPVLFMGQVLDQFKDKVIGKFNLNVRYAFDNDFSFFACGVFSETQLRSLNGSILSFKQILHYLRMYSLLTAFGFQYYADLIEDPETIETFPIYSLTSYFNTANLNHFN